ncbi:MAG: hypothetical protein DRP84_03320 [Spirochaetes bacterium]|nr:MAG: hypothetical protein DRP84_03320 [Spirochaetota bacterium]
MEITYNSNFFSFSFDYPVRILSSAFYNGGYGRRKAVLNLKTTMKELENTIPEEVVRKKLETFRFPLNTTAMMTSANLDFAQFIYDEEKGIKIGVAVSAGTSNALNISERSFTKYKGNPSFETGTINIVIFTNMWLLSDCLVSTIISATEAKSSALFDLKVKSKFGVKQATGTGTDSVTVVSGYDKRIQFAGGHTLFGQMVGKAVYLAVKKSLKKIKMDGTAIPFIEKEMGY